MKFLIKLFTIVIALCFFHDAIYGLEEDVIIFKGCSIIRRAFMSEAAKVYEKTTGIKINVTGGGAILGLRAVAAGDADIAGVCRPCLPEWFEEEKGIYMTQIAWDCLVFITHTSNPVNDISLEDAKNILLGNITNWKEIGGPDKKIICVFRSQDIEHGGKVSGVGHMTRLMIFKDSNISYTKNALFFRNSAGVEGKVETLPFTFGVTGISSARKRNIKVLTLNGIPITKENISSGTYRLFRPLYITTKGKPTGKIKAFVEWLLSDAGQEVVSQQGTVNLEEGKGLKEKFEFWENIDLISNYASSY